MPQMRMKLEGDQLVGYAIRMAREYRGLSINELAARLGYHRNTVTAIEKGERPVKMVELHGIAAVLKWPVEWLTSPTLPGDLGGYLGSVA